MVWIWNILLLFSLFHLFIFFNVWLFLLGSHLLPFFCKFPCYACKIQIWIGLQNWATFFLNVKCESILRALLCQNLGFLLYRSTSFTCVKIEPDLLWGISMVHGSTVGNIVIKSWIVCLLGKLEGLRLSSFKLMTDIDLPFMFLLDDIGKLFECLTIV